MSAQSDSRGLATNDTSDSVTEVSKDRDVALPGHKPLSNPGPSNKSVKNDCSMPPRCHFSPFDEHLNELVAVPSWQTDLDDYFAHIFVESVLSKSPIDEIVTGALQIVGRPTQAKLRAVALVMHTQWMRMQFRYKDADISAPEIVTLISRMADHLGRISAHAQRDFLDELSHLCIEKLKVTWRWYAVTRGVLPIPRENLFMRVMTVVVMVGHLFRGGHLGYGAVLDGLGYIAGMSPWPDAVALIYALLRELGPMFALQQVGCAFILRLLADLLPLTLDRVRGDPYCQLVSAINTLVAEWQRRTRVTLYHTRPKRNNQLYYAHHS